MASRPRPWGTSAKPTVGKTTMGVTIEGTHGAGIAALEHAIRFTLPMETRRLLMDWQREDMNRKFPFLRDVTDTSVSTAVWPRSRTWKRSQRSGKAKSGPTQRRTRVRIAPGGTKRPILRPELLERLQSRVTQLVQDIAKWP